MYLRLNSYARQPKLNPLLVNQWILQLRAKALRAE